MKKKKYALVLSGGGFKGAYQLGALRYLQEHWSAISGSPEMNFDVIAGVSVGALNGALLASQRFDRLEKLWALVAENGATEIFHSPYVDAAGNICLSFDQLKRDLLPHFRLSGYLLGKGLWNSMRKLFRKETPGLVDTLLQAAEKDFSEQFGSFQALADNSPLAEKLHRYLSLGEIPEATTFICGVVSLYDGLYYALSHQSFEQDADFVQAVLASSAMPIIWKPVPGFHVKEPELEIQNAVDGGIRNNSPLKDVVDFIQADPDDLPWEVFIINCSSGQVPISDSIGNIADIALRSLREITLAEVFNEDVRSFLKMNSLAQQAKGKLQLEWKGRPVRDFNYTLIQPSGQELGLTLDSRRDIILEREAFGYAQAESALTAYL